MDKKQIHKEMTIEEIFTHFPGKAQKLAQEITGAGLHCVGCQAATWETLEAGMLGHGYLEEEIEQLVSRLNGVLEESSDPSSIYLTQRAANKFKQILKEEGKETWHLRFGVTAAGCSGFEYALDFSKAAEAGDVVFHSQGIEIHVKKQMVDKLLGAEIDFVEKLHHSGFKVSNPNAKSSCGCGKSQSF